MDDQESSASGESYSVNRSRLVAGLLNAAAVAIAILAFLSAVGEYAEFGRHPAPATVNPQTGEITRPPGAFAAYVATTLRLVLWLGAALLLAAAGGILRRLEELPDAVRDIVRSGFGGYPYAATAEGVEVAPSDAPAPASLDEIARLLREVRDISLLGAEDRAMRLKAQAQETVAALEREVPDLLREHNWLEARRKVQRARERFPSLPAWDELDRRIEAIRAGVEAQDVENARRQVNDLASLGAWERAFDVVRDLLDRHPDSPAARDLARTVQVERGKADAEQRSRLMAQAQDASRRRDWISALSSANALIRQFPNSSEAAALRLDLPTLAANAEIQTRKRLENEIAELARMQRYGEAMRLARDLIDRYPRSPQAAVLREKLSQFEERARAIRGR